jgi:hypothetical protein
MSKDIKRQPQPGDILVAKCRIHLFNFIVTPIGPNEPGGFIFFKEGDRALLVAIEGVEEYGFVWTVLANGTTWTYDSLDRDWNEDWEVLRLYVQGKK